MRAAPLKGDCIVCQAPDPSRVAINAAIWPGAGMVRSVTYRADGTEVARRSGVPSLATCDPKTIGRHAEHIEESWREIRPGQEWRQGEVPVSTEFAEVMDTNTRVGMKATHLLERLLDEAGEIYAVTQPKLVLDIATKLGMAGASTQEGSRLKRNQQKIDVLAIFGLSSGHVRPPREEAEQEGEIDDLRAELNAERKVLAARAEAS